MPTAGDMIERIYRFAIAFTRWVRWVGWGVAAGIAIADLQRFERTLGQLESAPQEAAFAGATLVELVVLYIVARAWDRMGTLVDEGLRARLERHAG